MKRVILAGIVAMCVASTSVFAADLKLGYVDVQRALDASEEGKEAKEVLASKIKKLQDEINIKQSALDAVRGELEKQGMLLNDTIRAAKEKEYQNKSEDLQRFSRDAQNELQRKREELLKHLIEGMEKVIKNYGQLKGYTYIFLKNETLLFADDKSDLTDEILKLFNATRKK